LILSLAHRKNPLTPKSWPDEQKHGTEAYQADKLAKDSKVPKGNRNLDA
jgi:hypothetical protein